MRRIQQRAQGSGCRGAQAADDLREPDGIGAAPGDEREFEHMLDRLARFIAAFPIPVHRQHLPRGDVDRDQIRRHFARLLDTVEKFLCLFRHLPIG